MDNLEDNLKRDAHAVRLLQKEKDAVRARIMGTAPAVRLSPYRYSMWLHLVATPLAVLILVGGPVTYAAQASGPGGILYGLEISVVERVQESLQIGDDAQVRYHTQRLKERLDEVQESSATGPLEEDDQEAVARNVEEHAESLAASLAKDTEPEKKIRNLVRAKALMSAHETILEETDVASSSTLVDNEIEDSSDEYAAKDLEEAVSVVAEAIEDMRESALSVSSSTPAELIGQIEDIAEAIQEGDLGEALYLSSETQANQLRDRYLTNTEGPEEEQE